MGVTALESAGHSQTSVSSGFVNTLIDSRLHRREAREDRHVRSFSSSRWHGAVWHESLRKLEGQPFANAVLKTLVDAWAHFSHVYLSATRSPAAVADVRILSECTARRIVSAISCACSGS
jgi:hypothetical protein